MAEMAVITQPVKNVSTLRSLLEKSKGELEKALVSRIDPDQFIRVAMTTIQRKPKLLECDAQSLIACLMESAQMGLPPDNAWGTYLVPFRDKMGRPHCQLIISFRGLLRIVRRSGQIANIWAEVVRRGDVFKVVKGDSPRLIHEPKDLDGEDITHAYAVAHEFDAKGEVIKIPEFIVMTADQIDGIRARSKSPNEGPWVTDWVDMAKKTVLRNLCKYLPVDPIAQQALSIEDRVFENDEAKKVAKELPTIDAFFEPLTQPQQKETPETEDETGAGADQGTGSNSENPRPRRAYTRKPKTMAEAAPVPPTPPHVVNPDADDLPIYSPDTQEPPEPSIPEHEKLQIECREILADLRENGINAKLDPDFEDYGIDQLKRQKMKLIGMAVVK